MTKKIITESFLDKKNDNNNNNNDKFHCYHANVCSHNIKIGTLTINNSGSNNREIILWLQESKVPGLYDARYFEFILITCIGSLRHSRFLGYIDEGVLKGVISLRSHGSDSVPDINVAATAAILTVIRFVIRYTNCRQ